MNLAAGFVCSFQEDGITSLKLINDMDDRVLLSSTRYNQGRKEAVFGPPYTITVGIPMTSPLSSTRKEFKDQNKFIKLVHEKVIHSRDLVGSSKYLAAMINGGSKVESLAWNAGHLKLLQAQNKNTKVSRTHEALMVQ